MSHPQTSLSLASSDGRAGPDPARRSTPAVMRRASPSESASSRETWPTQNMSQQDMTAGRGPPEEEEEEEEQTVVHRVNNLDRLQLRDVVREGLDATAQRMREQPDEFLDELKADLRDILGSMQRREEFALLQKLLQVRRDLSPEGLLRTHRTQLEIFVALRTGILAFLHPDISVTQTALVEIFFHKRCRNMACQSQLPADECTCDICRTTSGFCNACMCMACSKFDFDANTCRWVGCDVCLHWTHSDCAIRGGQISMGVSLKAGGVRQGTSPEIVFRCRACGHVSELLGWVKDVFKMCAPLWDRDALVRELDCVRRIFRGSDDTSGKQLYWKCEELLDKLKNGIDASTAFKEIQYFFQEYDADDKNDGEADEGKPLDRKEACDRMVDVVQEAVAKMESVAEEKAVQLKKARLALEVSNREVEDKKRELAELQAKKKQQIEELESIVRLKKAEADMFQFKSDEARREAEGLQRIVSAKAEKVEEEYAGRYLKLRLDEAESERRLLFEKLQGPDFVRLLRGEDPSQTLLLNKIHGLFERVGMVPTMSDGGAPSLSHGSPGTTQSNQAAVKGSKP